MKKGNANRKTESAVLWGLRVDGEAHDKDQPHGWIQWKGTDVCCDVHCVCGYHDHVDGGFFYLYKCPSCGKRYAVGQIVHLHELPDDVADAEEALGGLSWDWHYHHDSPEEAAKNNEES